MVMTSRPPPRTSSTRSKPSVRTSRNSISGIRVKWNQFLHSAGEPQPENLPNTMIKEPFGWMTSVKDTVLVPVGVARRPRHVEEHQSSVVGPVDDDLVQLHGRVHPPHVGLIPGTRREKYT